MWDDEKKLFNLDNKNNNSAITNKQHFQFWKSFITKKLFCYEENCWKIEMEKKDKLRTYRLFKTNLKFENYLNTSESYIGRRLMSTLRSGTNILQIEKGRWTHQEEKDRLCTFCDLKKVENEIHFITECYHDLRKCLFNKILEISNGKWNLANLDTQSQFIFLLNGSGDEHEMKIFYFSSELLDKMFQA